MTRPHHRTAFLWLVLAQGAHSIEEYAFRLYDVFAPARFLSTLVAADPRVGFLILNTGFFVFGMWCYVARVRPGHRSAVALVCVWIVVEMINGIGHAVVAVMRGEYFPGVATAPVLVALAVYLAISLRPGA